MSKLLIIDDEPDFLESTGELLRVMIKDIEVVTAGSGSVGLQKAHTEMPDAILLDINIPDMDGYEICRRLKESANTHDIPVIVITGMGTDSGAKVKALGFGALAFLEKPYGVGELIAQVQVMLHISGMRHALKHERDMLEKKVRERTASLRAEIEERRALEDELRKSHDQLRALNAYLQNVREEERKTISRDIHDDLGQLMTGLKIDLRMLTNEIGHLPDDAQPPMREKADSIERIADEISRKIHDISMRLRPSMLDHLGVEDTMQWLINDFGKKTGIACTFTKSGIRLHDDELSITLFRILQETLTNIIKHSASTQVAISLDHLGTSIKLSVRDNGKGIDETCLINNREALGILGMSERVHNHGGRIEVKGTPGQGTTLFVTLPVEAPDA